MKTHHVKMPAPISQWRRALASAAFLAALLATLPATANPALANELGSGRLDIAGTRLVVSPEHQTVPFRTPTVVDTTLDGFDPDRGTVPGDLRILADFTGPEIAGVLVLETAPNEPFRIPRLSLEGEYRLANIRLLQGDALLLYADPRSVLITVTQVLITKVTSRPLTVDEIRDLGIVVDDDSFRAYNFSFGFGVAGDVVDYNLPVVFLPVKEPGGDRFLAMALTGGSRFSPPGLAPFMLDFPPEERPEISGCEDPFGCQLTRPPPLPGVILFPTDVSLLHQFFAVVLMVQNGAPAGDPLIVRDLTARLTLPAGLRLAETEPPTVLGVPVPIRVPGPDGELGTNDDLTFLVAQASGEAQALVEGLREGTHIVQFDLEGVLDGLPTGIQRVTGTARGAVLVRDPTLSIHIVHPDVVRKGEDYSLLLTLTNTSTSPANLLTVTLPTGRLSGVDLVHPQDSRQTIDSLLPGDSELLEFRLRSRRDGRVIAAAVRNSANLSPTFELTVGVGENGIPLSPNSIVLPRETNHLPPHLVRNALRLIGLGFSLATAPAALAIDLPRVTRPSVDQRIYQLAQAGRHVALGEDLFDSVAVLAAEWTGSRDRDWEWDLLRRSTQRGALVGDAFGQVFAAESDATSPAAAFRRFGRSTGFLPPLFAALAASPTIGSGLELVVKSRTSGLAVSGSGTEVDRVRDLPFADLMDLGAGRLAFVAVLEGGGYRVEVRAAGSGGVDLSLLVPVPGGGAPRLVTWHGVALSPRAIAAVEFHPSDTEFELHLDMDGDGAVDAQYEADTVVVQSPRPFAAVSATQNAGLDPSGHAVEVLFSADVDRSALAPADPHRFEIPGKVSNGGIIPSEEALVLGGQTLGGNLFEGMRNSRVVRLYFDNPLSPLIEQELTVRDVRSLGGEQLDPPEQRLGVVTTLAHPGMRVAGRVIGPDGEPVDLALVELLETDYCSVCVEPCRKHRTAAVRADSNGSFLFDYVRQTECGDLFELRATDQATNQRGSAHGRVRFPGQTSNLDILMAGRGSIRGRVRYGDGSVPGSPRVVAHSPVYRDSRLAIVSADGNYEVGDLPVGTIEIVAEDGEGNFAASTVELAVSGAVATRDLTIVRRTAQPTGELRGRVLRPDGVTAVLHAFVALYVKGGLIGVRQSGFDGVFDFGLVPAGPAEIEASDGESGRAGARAFFEVEADRINEHDVLLVEENGTIEGTVYRRVGGGLEPLDGAVVYVNNTPFNTVSQGGGHYSLPGVFVGTWQLVAADVDRQRKASAEISVQFDGQVVVRDLVFEEDPGESVITGTVLDFDGSPVAGATVHLAVGDHSWSHETFTAIDGEFAISAVSPGPYSVHGFRGADGGLATTEVRFPGDSPAVEIRFRRGAVRGVVKQPDASGGLVGVKSLIDYRTTVVRQGLVGLDLENHTLETGDDGSFELPDILVGDYVLTAVNAFFGELSVKGRLERHGEIHEHELVFRPNGLIAGRVVDHDGVTPVEGARVLLRHPGFDAEAPPDQRTDADGHFAFDLVPPADGPFPIDADSSHGAIYRTARVWVDYTRQGQELDVQIALQKQGSIRGHVEDSHGDSVPNALVTWQESAFPRRRGSVQSDDDGGFAFTNIFAGTVTLSAEALGTGLGGKTTVDLVDEGAELAGVVIRLQDTGRLAGRVLSPLDGLPVAGAEVQLFAYGLFDVTTSDGSGEFLFDLLPIGVYSVRVFDPRSGRQGREDELAIQSNGQTLELSILLEARGLVTGHVFEPGAVPVPGAAVALQSAGLAQFRTVSSSDGDGIFEFAGVPEGAFELTTREPQGPRRASASGEVMGEGARVEIDLVLEQTGVVRGQVLNPPGLAAGPFQPVTVAIFQEQDGVGAADQVGGTDQCTYRFDGVLAGASFEILAVEPGTARKGQAFGRLDFEGQEIELDVQMEPIGELEVRVVDHVGLPVADAEVRVSNRAALHFQSLVGISGSDGTVAFASIFGGDVSVTAKDLATQLGGAAAGRLETEGQRMAFQVRLEPSGSIEGTLLESEGVTPAANALAVLTQAGRTLTTRSDDAGHFRFDAVPLGSFSLFFQEQLGPGELTVGGAILTNLERLELGLLVLDDFDPQVVDVSPTDGAVDQLPDVEVRLSFSEAIDRSAFDDSWITLRDATSDAWVPVALEWADDEIVVLRPLDLLDSFTHYRVRVEVAIRDRAGRHLERPFQAGFTTADVDPLTVSSVFPEDGAIQVPVDVQLRVSFSEPVLEASLPGGAFLLQDMTAGAGVATTALQSADPRLVLLTPAVDLEPESRYRLEVHGVEDRFGNAMVAAFVSRFETLDTTLPVVELVLPGGPLTEGVETRFEARPVQTTDLESVSFFGNGELLGTDSESPFEAGYIPSAVDGARGSVSLSAVGTDRAGNIGVPSVVTRQVFADLAPEIEVRLDPAEEMLPSRNLKVTGRATDSSGLVQVQISLTGGVEETRELDAAGDTELSFEEEFGVPVLPPTDSLSVIVRAVDRVGKISETVPGVIRILPDLESPVIASVSPASGTRFTSGDIVSMRAEVSDNVGLAQVRFDLGALSHIEQGGMQRVFEWVVPAPAVDDPTSVDLRIEAVDHAGNRSEEVIPIAIDPLFDPDRPVVGLSGCPSDGDKVLPGSIVELGFRATDDDLVNTVTLYVDGSTVESLAVNTSELDSQFFWTPPLTAAAGQRFEVEIRALDFAGNSGAAQLSLAIPMGPVLTGDQTLDFHADGSTLFVGDGTFTVVGPLSVAELVIGDGARIVPSASDIRIRSEGELRVQCGTAIDASGAGYGGGEAGHTDGYAPAAVRPAGPDSGGSHGGAGAMADFDASAAEVYDSVYMPRLAGGGGALDREDNRQGGAGGGVVDLEAAELVVHGEILARGEDGTLFAAAGAGGAVYLRGAALTGVGAIDASGGGQEDFCPWTDGAGGGGRVSVRFDEVVDFDVLSQILVQGGGSTNCGVTTFASAGTLYVLEQEGTYGRLIVDSGETPVGQDRAGLATRLPTLGSGSVVALEVLGSDALVTGSSAYRPRWLGSWMQLLDGAGGDLGTFEVVDLDNSGRARLAGAGYVTSAAAYQGHYRFDQIRLRNSGGLVAADDLYTTDLRVEEGASGLPRHVRSADMTVVTGATAHIGADAIERPMRMVLDVVGSLTIEPDAVLDVSGQGYIGGVGAEVAGTAPSTVISSQPDAGGSHGGGGSLGTGTGPAGEVYDSVYLPRLGGGGGALEQLDNRRSGGAGGGSVEIRAGELSLDGEVHARGEDRNVFAAAGAGGSVLIDAGVVRGVGLVDVSGGDHDDECPFADGVGGGGRVAFFVDLFDGFDPAQQSIAHGGRLVNCGFASYAAPGTLYVLRPGMIHGDLHVDQGAVGGEPVLATILPSVGRGVVGRVEIDTADPQGLWIESDPPAPHFDLGVIGMWFRVGGVDYRIVDQSPDRLRVLLRDAVGVVGPGDTYLGVYKFDMVVVGGGAAVQFLDEREVGTFVIDSGSSVEPPP